MGQPRLTAPGTTGRRSEMRLAAGRGVWSLMVAAGLVTAAAPAQALSFSCPLRVASKAAAVADMPGSNFKQGFLPTSLAYLIGVAVLDSARADSSELAPAISANQWQWNLESLKSGAGVVACRYEGGILLTRNLTPSLRECLASVQRSSERGVDGYGLAQAQVSCR